MGVSRPVQYLSEVRRGASIADIEEKQPRPSHVRPETEAAEDQDRCPQASWEGEAELQEGGRPAEGQDREDEGGREGRDRDKEDGRGDAGDPDDDPRLPQAVGGRPR